MRKVISCLAALIVVITFWTCNKGNPVGPNQSSPYLYGKVVDNQGNPIEGVRFHYIPSLIHVASPKIKLAKINSIIRINFVVPKESYVNLSVHRLYTQDLIATLVNDTLSAGAHSVGFNDSSVTDGVYYYRLTMDTTVIVKYIVLIQDSALLPLTTPLALTNSSGQFSEPLRIFGIGMRFYVSSSQGPTPTDTVFIPNTIQVVLYKTGYKTLIEPITIDTTYSVNKQFTLEK